jgi:cytochrome c-type biogenesis protein CcmH
MLIFWLCAAVLVALPLALMAPALMGRARPSTAPAQAPAAALFQDRLAALEGERRLGALTDEDFRAARGELEHELLAEAERTPTAASAGAGSPLMAMVVVAFVPLVAFGLYLQLGTPRALDAASDAAGARAGMSPVERAAAAGELPHSLQEMVARLEARLADDPGNADGWLMLGRSYAAFNRLPESRDALLRANELRPDHPLTLVALAETTVGLQGNRLDGEPERLLRRVLAIAPDFPRALWLVGIADFRRGDRAAAAASWRRLLAIGGLNEKESRQVREALAAADGAPVAAAPQSPAAPAVSLRVDVRLAPSLAARAAPNDVVYVFARAAEGPPMPLAVSRHRVADLPLTVTLDDSMAMAPQLRLSMFPAVVAAARISRNGSATPTPGDLRGRSAPLAPGADVAVSVLIDDVVP